MSYKATTLSSFGLALLAIEVYGPSAPPGGTTTPPLVDALGVRIVDADATIWALRRARVRRTSTTSRRASPKDEADATVRVSSKDELTRQDDCVISECGGASTSLSQS